MSHQVKIEESWGRQLQGEFDKPYFDSLTEYVRGEYARGACYPPGGLIFNAFNHTPFDAVKVVILGQDPYHEPGQAHGLCFSVPDGVPYPPSLRNILQEVHDETGADIPQTGNLTRWARQGVLLLNTCLTVRAHEAFSHSGKGWEELTDAVISSLSENKENLVFMLWGGPAGRKKALIDESKHLVLLSAHPSPLSAYRGFFGNRHFVKCNEYLTEHGKEAIVW